jgi:hypothetical protein
MCGMQRTLTCPSLPTYGGAPDFEVWIWDSERAQQRLADLVTRDNLRSPFSPVIGADHMSIDPEWGMHRSAPGSSMVVEINAMWLPSGHYRLDLELAATGASNEDPAEITVFHDHASERHHGFVARRLVAASDHQPSIEFDVDNRGGATSGAAVVIDVSAKSATSIDVSKATLTLVDQRGISPFSIFR